MASAVRRLGRPTPRDVLAGLVTGLFSIPEGMAYASIGGFNPVVGPLLRRRARHPRLGLRPHRVDGDDAHQRDRAVVAQRARPRRAWTRPTRPTSPRSPSSSARDAGLRAAALRLDHELRLQRGDDRLQHRHRAADHRGRASTTPPAINRRATTRLASSSTHSRTSASWQPTPSRSRLAPSRCGRCSTSSSR